jgi:type I restriction enzyme R subunit
MNADLQARYAANRLRVVRQVHYSVHHENSIDLVLFVNGIPVATAELKSHYTQGVQDAVYQYKTDREPFFKPKNVAEPLLAFPGGALVHFAVSNAAAEMTTRLAWPGHHLPALQPGQRRGRRQPAQGRHRHRLPLERGLAARQLPADPRALPGAGEERQEAAGRLDLPAVPPAHVTRKLVAAVTAGRPGRQVPDSALGRLGQDELDRLDGALPGRPARRRRPEGLRHGHRVSDRTVLDDQLQRSHHVVRAHAGRGGRDQGRGRQQEQGTGRGAVGRQEDRGVHAADLPLRAGRGAQAGGHQRASALR